jgi:hypothetical protein
MNILKNGFVLYSLVLLLSCSDNVTLKEKDLEKYSWLTPFVNECNYMDFKGKHNIDLGKMEFEYNISGEKWNYILPKFDSIANNEKWETIIKTKRKRKFSKFISEETKIDSLLIMSIEVNLTQDKLFFKIE